MQVGEKVGHLLLIEAAVEGRHHSLPGQDDVSHLCIGGWSAAGQRTLFEDVVEIGRNLLQAEIVVAMAMGATHIVEVLSFGLLVGELGSAVATGGEEDRNKKDGKDWKKPLKRH